jgi:hypothetical protein
MPTPRPAIGATAALSLPTSAIGANEFTEQLAAALTDPGTRIYVDTSFLMWMTAIGSPARQQLIAWLCSLAGERMRIPVWAAHEYYRHHTEGTLVQSLETELAALERAVAGAFAVIWPLLDEPAGAMDARVQQNEASDVLRAVPKVTEIARRSAANYQRHAQDVIAFINAHALGGSRVPAYFETLDAVAEARFTGRVPPGFKDRRKKPRAQSDDETVVRIGSNRWGDLVFWREVLADAKSKRARRVILLTRDAKNDWRAAGPLATEPTGGDGVPPPHPFLKFEAALEAGVEDVMLVDQRRLAAAAKSMAEGSTEAFRYVAAAPGLPPPVTESERRAEEVRRRKVAEDAVRGSLATADGVRFLDPASVKSTAATLAAALLESRAEKALKPAVEACEVKIAGGGVALGDLLSEAGVEALGVGGLVQFARRLGQKGAETGEGAAAVSELAVLLRHLPPKTAGALYLGLLADAFLDPERNAARAAPRSPALETLYALQTESWALAPIKAILQRLKANKQVPIYAPNAMAPRLKLICRAHGDRDPPNQLRSLQVRGLDLVTAVQPDRTLQLSVRLGGEPAAPHRLAELAAALYGLPLALLDLEADVTDAFELDELIGFRHPRDVWLTPEELLV